MNLSIIISVYNAGPYVGKCLDSVIAQGLPADEYEIICINDGSTDNSQEVLEQYAERYSHIRIIQQENRGISAVRNRGIAEARGTYLCFIDGDDFWLPNSFSKVYRYVTEQNYWSGSGPDVIPYNSRRVTEPAIESLLLETKTKESQPIQAHKIETGYEYVARFNFNTGVWYYLVKPDFIKQIGLKFADGKVIEDGPFTTELLLNAREIQAVDTDVYVYVVRPNSITTNKSAAHLRKMTEGYQNALAICQRLLAEHKDLPTEGLKRLLSRRDGYIFFMLLRIMRYGSAKELKETIAWLKQHDLYPMEHFPNEEYPGATYKLLTFVLNHPWLAVAAKFFK